MSEKHTLVYPSDGTGSGLYRMTWPGKAATAAGKPVNVLPRSPQIVVDREGKIHGINVGSGKVVVFQRAASAQYAQVIPILQSQGIKVVIDMDDSLSTIHPRNVAFKSYDPRLSHQMNWMHAATACNLADLVTVTTAALAEEYGAHGRVEIIPNHIPESYLTVQRRVNEVPVVGWAGWTNTHVDDLQVTRGMVNQALTETGAKFAAFGDDRIFNDLAIRNRPPHEHWGFTNINEYPARLAGMDIGIVPLQKSKFNECKSWLKGLEMASLGIVPVVTPIGDQMNLVDLGIALPAENPKQWYNTIKELILDNDMRNELSDKCRKVASEWTIEGNVSKWWNAWNA